MSKAAQIKGVAQLTAALQKQKREKAAAFKRGVSIAAAQLLRYSLPLVPVQLGALRASAGVHVTGEGFGTVAHTSFGTEYAVFVHETPNPPVAHGSAFNTKHADKISGSKKFRKKRKLGRSRIWFNRGPNQQAKFLEQPFRENRPEFVKIIKTELES